MSSSAPPGRSNPTTQAALRLAALPQWAVAVVVLLAVVVGLFVGGLVGAVLLVFALLALLALLGLAWEALTLPERLLRIAIIVFLASLALVRLIPQ